MFLTLLDREVTQMYSTTPKNISMWSKTQDEDNTDLFLCSVIALIIIVKLMIANSMSP